MKFCKQCGKHYDDATMFCSTCGERLVTMNENNNKEEKIMGGGSSNGLFADLKAVFFEQRISRSFFLFFTIVFMVTLGIISFPTWLGIMNFDRTGEIPLMMPGYLVTIVGFPLSALLTAKRLHDIGYEANKVKWIAWGWCGLMFLSNIYMLHEFSNLFNIIEAIKTGNISPRMFSMMKMEADSFQDTMYNINLFRFIISLPSVYLLFKSGTAGRNEYGESPTSVIHFIVNRNK